MSGLQVPLYLRILGWLALNIVLVAAMSYAFAARDQSGLNMLLTESVQERMVGIAHNIAEDVEATPRDQRDLRLRQLSARHGAALSTREIGAVPGDYAPQPPGASAERANGSAPAARAPTGGLNGPGPPHVSDQPGFGPQHFELPPGPGPQHIDGPGGFGPEFVEIMHSTAPSGYNVIVRTPVHGGPPHLVEVVAHVGSLLSLLMFLGIGRTLMFVVLVIVISALLWWPFAWQVTRSIRDLLFATRRMAQGRLETRVSVARRDEIGQLAFAINMMAEHLQGYLHGQRQFMADFAHEIVSPVARMQIGLGILEAHVPAAGAAALEDVREDLEQMAEMLEELLLFSRSALELHRPAPGAVALADVVSRVLAKEAGNTPVDVQVGSGLLIEADSPLIERALSNLIRNARRFAPKDGYPIEIVAQPSRDRIKIAVRDRGPGVPPNALARLGEPFFRPELDRGRTTGGFGLGLAIVRRCTEASNGQVVFRNREGGGFEAELDLPAHALRP